MDGVPRRLHAAYNMPEHKSSKAPSGETLPTDLLERLRAALARVGDRELGRICGVSAYTVSRAAAGQRVMRACRAAIAAGLAHLDREAQP